MNYSMPRLFVGFTLLLLLQSCGVNPPHLRGSLANGPSTHLADQTAVAVDQLLGAMNPPLATDTTILVASFVDLNDMTVSTKLGRLVAEQTANQLIKRGYQVPEVRLTLSLHVRDDGEYILSRDVADLKLSDKLKAGVVVTGTTSSYRGTTYINFRLLRYVDGVALSAANLELNDRDGAR